MIRVAWYLFAGLVASLLLWHVPLSSYQPLPTISEVFYFDPQRPDLAFSAGESEEAGLLAFSYAEPAGNLSRFQVYYLSARGQQAASFLLPPAQIERPGEKEKVQLKGEGFLTHPDDGSFLVWYPRLGRHIYFFDSNGQFLWEKESTQYLHSFPAGKWLMTVSGDHSRLQIRLPSLETLVDIEGNLFTSYQLQSEAASGWQGCLGFINGDVIWLDPAEKKSLRLPGQQLLKGLACDFSGQWLAQVEKKDTDEKGLTFIHDALQLSALDDQGGQTAIFDFALPDYYPYTLPLAFNRQAALAATVAPDIENKPEIWLIDAEGQLLYRSRLGNKESADFDADDWRAGTIGNQVYFWNSQELYIFDAHGQVYYRRFSALDRVFAHNQRLYLQQKNRVLALKTL